VKSAALPFRMQMPLLPFLRASLDVDGSDVSPDMLALYREEAAREGFAPGLYAQTMHQLDLPRTYRTIVACGSFGIASTRQQDALALRRLYQHLPPGGVLLLDHHLPYGAHESWQLEHLRIRAVWAAIEALSQGNFLAFRGPQESAAHQFQSFGSIENVGVVPHRVIENASHTPPFGPDHRHIHMTVGAVVPIHSRETGRSQNLNARIDVQVVLFAAYVEILDAVHERARTLLDIHLIIHTITTGVRNPGTAGHEFPKHALAEGITHAAVTSGETGAVCDRLTDTPALFVGDLGHSDDRNKEMQRLHLALIFADIQCVMDLDGETLLFQEVSKDVCYLLGFMTQPPTPDD
jgi:SAM-dependent methyltransferase